MVLIDPAWMPSHADTTGCRPIAAATAAAAAGYRRERFFLYRGWLPVRWVVPFTLPSMVTPRTCNTQHDAVFSQVRMPAILATLAKQASPTLVEQRSTCVVQPATLLQTLTLSVVRPFLACGLNSSP